MEINSITAQRIREVRDSQKLTAKYVAAAIDMSLSAYSKMENGETQITIEKLHLVAQALNVAFATLLPEQRPHQDQMVNVNHGDNPTFTSGLDNSNYTDRMIVDEILGMLKRRDR